jgi:hypothetical protein
MADRSKPKRAPKSDDNTRLCVMLSLSPKALDELDWLCQDLAEREGSNPKRLRSHVVRMMIREKYRLQQGKYALPPED